jgi:hypothetical protein
VSYATPATVNQALRLQHGTLFVVPSVPCDMPRTQQHQPAGRFMGMNQSATPLLLLCTHVKTALLVQLFLHLHQHAGLLTWLISSMSCSREQRQQHHHSRLAVWTRSQPSAAHCSSSWPSSSTGSSSNTNLSSAAHLARPREQLRHRQHLPCGAASPPMRCLTLHQPVLVQLRLPGHQQQARQQLAAAG